MTVYQAGRVLTKETIELHHGKCRNGLEFDLHQGQDVLVFAALISSPPALWKCDIKSHSKSALMIYIF